MGAIVDRAEELAELLRDTDVKASTDIRDTVPPCLLVVPVPRLDYTGSTLEGTVEVTWTIVALANPPADLEAARELENLIGHLRDTIPDVSLAEPASYVIPGAETAVPAYLVTLTETATEA